MGDRNITKGERVFMAVSKQDEIKKSNKQWLRYGATSVLVALGMGAGAAPNVSANETTAGSQPGAFATSESDESVDTKDTDDRDKDGDGRDDETGEPVAAESSSEVTEEPSNEPDEKETEETPTETTQDESVTEAEGTEQDSNASEADTSTSVNETATDTVVEETPDSVDEPDSVASTESSVASEGSTAPIAEGSVLSSVTSEMSEASSSVSSEATDEASETSDTSSAETATNDSDAGTTVAETGEVSETTEGDSQTPETDTESASETETTITETPAVADDSVVDEGPTVSEEGTYAADSVINVPNPDNNTVDPFKATDYGVDPEVTVTYEDDKFIWINLSATSTLNNIDMTALKAYAVRNRLNIAFTQAGNPPKDTTTGLTEAQQASIDLFNKDAFNLRPETRVSVDNGALLVYWPTRDQDSQTFDLVDHSDVSYFADKIGLPWIVASAAEMRTAVQQTTDPGTAVADSTNLPAPFAGNTALLQSYIPVEAIKVGTQTWMIMAARSGVTTDNFGTAVSGGNTIMLAQYTSAGLTGQRVYIAPGSSGSANGINVYNNMDNGTGGVKIGDGGASKVYAVGINGQTNGTPANTTTATGWQSNGIGTGVAAETHYYVKQADGTYKEIPVDASKGASHDAQTSTLTGASGPYFSDQYTITSDVLPGYKLITSDTEVSWRSPVGSPTIVNNADGSQTVTGEFTPYTLDTMLNVSQYYKATLLDRNNPFNLATVQAMYPSLNLTKVPIGAVLYTYPDGNGNYVSFINWPVVDSDGNLVGMQKADFLKNGGTSASANDSTTVRLFTSTQYTSAQQSASAAMGNPV